MEHDEEGINRREKDQKPRVALEAIAKLPLDIFLLPLDLVDRARLRWGHLAVLLLLIVALY